MRVGLLVLCLLLGAGAVNADEAITAAQIISGDEISLSDGRVLRLAGIEATPDAKAFLQTNVVGHVVTLQDAAPDTDRYGRVVALAHIDGSTETLQDILLQNGLAFVYPALGDEPQLDRMLAEENAARQMGKGYWADHADVLPDNAESLYGKYGFVTGVVTKAERVKNKVYLNFGADWRTDFTIAIAAHDLRAFKNAGADPLAWQGKKLRVRGWVKRDFGPMITVTDPHQTEFVN